MVPGELDRAQRKDLPPVAAISSISSKEILGIR